MTIHYTNTPNPVDFPKLSTIDRLWGEALDRAVPDTYSNLTWTQVERIKSVFAELIVRECGQVAWRNTPDTEELEYSHLIKDKILEHFGLEE